MSDAPCPHCPKCFTEREYNAHMEREHSDKPDVPFVVMETWYYSTERKLNRLTKRSIVRLYLTGDDRIVNELRRREAGK